MLRVITNKNASELTEFLSSKRFGVTSIEAQGAKGKVNVIYLVLRRNNLSEVIKIIQRFNPKAFYTVEDIRSVKEGTFPEHKYPSTKVLLGPFRFFRKGK